MVISPGAWKFARGGVPGIAPWNEGSPKDLLRRGISFEATQWGRWMVVCFEKYILL